ncbi:class I SAM-dependent methyltransferase [Siculibacillus lacustris]|uniref:Class I SAM-dependent methyltransferase n=1 Tax=Siculibacillus lacustris TaxID=1549641 RepID=A0A4Q9VQZ8_9HYPH|nr:class I SAM-dependent methyltransferase [Siculibacillus lacustris]TBW38270.1 class I SAM-dependent methyltransferase [Siculibacillus lacustris]
MTVLCRHCSRPLETVFADLGRTPLSNAFLPADDPARIAAEPIFPLKVMVCDVCLLVQTTETVPAESIFTGDYAYLSSYSSSWLAHAKAYTEAMIDRFGLDERSLVVEIASNDGYLLQYFVERQIPVLGIEPAANAAAIAEAKGVPTLVRFFGQTTAADLVAEGRRADLIAANNVLAHVPDIADFVAGFATLLAPTGVATFEFPHLLRLIEGLQFDTIYHEHYSYLSMLAVERILAGAGLAIFDVEELPTHGGSVRVFVQHAGGARPVDDRFRRLRDAEIAFGLADPATYAQFDGKIAAVAAAFRTFLDDAKRRGLTVAAYGAAAKGNTFLSVCGATAADVAFVVDRNPVKQGKLTPGSHIPVLAPEHLAVARPDRIVILPWNLADEIRRSNATVADWGGRFVVAVPTLTVFETDARA